MSAPYLEPSSSISSSGYSDGLGWRELCFDREAGTILERLHLRPEVAAFSRAIRERTAHLGDLELPSLATPRAIEHDASGDIVVVSEIVAGTRLSHLLDLSREDAYVPGLDAAIGYLLEGLSTLGTLHAVAGVSHGLVTTHSTLLQSDGGVAFLDAVCSAAVDRLGLPAEQLWNAFGIAPPPGMTPRLDEACDMSQLALGAVMLVRGRTIDGDDYPDSMPLLLIEVAEVAQIRGGNEFASSLQRILRRMLPMPGRRPYGSVNEPIAELQALVRKGIGVDACRAALVAFVQRFVRPPGPDFDPSPDDDDDPDRSEDLSTSGGADAALEFDVDLEEIADPLDKEAAADADGAYELSAEEPDADGLLSADDGATSAWADEPLAALQETGGPYDAERDDVDTAGYLTEPEPEGIDCVSLAESPPGSGPDLGPVDDDRPGLPPEGAVPESAEVAAVADPPGAPDGIETAPEQRDGLDPGADGGEVPVPAAAVAEPAAPATIPVAPRGSGSRRKRQSQKSARARKDKLRSTTTPDAAVSAPPGKSEPGRSMPAWTPRRVETPLQAAVPAPEITPPALTPTAQPRDEVPPAPFSGPREAPAATPPQTHALVSYVPAIAAPPPVFPPLPAVRAPMPRFGPAAVPWAATVPPAPYGGVEPVAHLPTVKVKTAPPAGYTPVKTSRRRIPPLDSTADTATHVTPLRLEMPAAPPRRWPIVAGIAALVAAATMSWIFVSTRRMPASVQPGATPIAAVEVPPAVRPPVPQRGMGMLVIRTDPPAVKVLLDGVAAGVTPVTLDAVRPGRHQIAFVSASGTVKRTVRVAAGATVNIGVSTFSGWVAIAAPFVAEVSEDGKPIGTTEQGRLMLAPGSHTLTLHNASLGYSAEQQVGIAAGEVSSIRIDPKGQTNLNAIPWAEVWVDGRRIGDTPIANYPLTLGTRDIVFRHPQLGERRVTTTVRADRPTAVAVDLTRPAGQ